MENITFIIPLHIYNKTVEPYLKNAFTSLKAAENLDKCQVLLVGPANVTKKAEALYAEVGCPQALSVCTNTETDVFTQINKAVYQVVTKYFTVLEFDDVLYPYWGKVMERYTEYEKGVSAYLPICELVADNTVVGFVNEIAWQVSFSPDFVSEAGYLTLDSLETYIDFFMHSSLIKTEDFISCGGLKPSLKFVAWYEFMLRLAQKNKRIFVVPRVCAQHTVKREGSYTDEAYKTISPEEGQWLIKTAREEYFFTEDRKKEFSDNVEETE